MKLYNRGVKLWVLLFLVNISAISQEMLKKEDAVIMAMEYNFDIQVAINNQDIAKNNSGIQNSGYLPSLSGTAGANYSSSSGFVIPKSGEKQEVNNNQTNGYNASISIQYTLFDGFGRSNTYKKLQENYQISKLQARLMIESTVLNIFNSYYEIARLTQDVNNQEETMNISRERLQRATYSNEYGQGSQLDILNAEVDYNNDSITYLTNTQLLANEKRNLNLILGRDVNIEFRVDTTLSYAQNLILDTLLDHSKSYNVSLLQKEVLLQTSEYDIKATTANMIPKLFINGSYGWNENNLGATSFIDKSQGSGPSLGATLSWNIYDGGATRVRMQNSKIALENQTVSLKKERLNIERNLNNAWTAYKTALFVKNAQEKNLETAQINFDRSVDQYKLGQISSIFFRQAQLNLLNAQLALNRARYSAKLAELILLQISGDLDKASF